MLMHEIAHGGCTDTVRESALACVRAVCVSVRARARARVCVCACVSAWACVRACVRELN